MKKIALAAFLMIILAAYNFKARKARAEHEEIDKTFTTTSYNYTPHQLYFIAFKEISHPFKIDEAPFGGSVLFRNASDMKMDDGKKIFYSPSNCCFIWSGQTDRAIRVRVVWNVIYDARDTGEDYDERTSRKSAPGTRWCQAYVDIEPATGLDRPKMVFLHFLADGSVQAQLGTFLTAAPLTSEQVKAHSSPLPEGQICTQEIENPFYGIPEKPHME